MTENSNTPNDIKNENDKFFKGMMSFQPVVDVPFWYVER